MSLLAALAPTRAVVDGVSRLCLLLILWIFSQYAHAEYSYHLYYDQNYYATPVEACASNATLLVANFNKCPYGGCTPVREVSNYVIEPPVPYGDSIVYYCSITIELQSNPPELRTYTHWWMSRVGTPDLCEDGQPVDPITGKCPEPPKCQISLSGFPAEVEPGKKLEGLQAQVTCTGKSPEGIAVTITSDVEDNSGGHKHIPGRRPAHAGEVGLPKGNVTDADGIVPFSFTAPAPAGDHTVTAKCTDNSCGEATGKVNVGYKDLVNIPSSSLYALTVDGQTMPIGAKDWHPANHYLRQEAVEILVIAAGLYKELYPNNPPLHLNDASLERGGVFDIYQNWSKPHQCHSRGHGIDVMANNLPGSIPQSIRDKFLLALKRIGITVGHEYPGGTNPNEHFHLYLITGGCEK